MSNWLFHKPIGEIDRTDLQRLIDEAVPESQTIEYKQVLKMDDKLIDQQGRLAKNDRWEFLADVSSFANASGGHLIYGLAEADSKPTGFVSLRPTNSDQLERRILEAIRSGTEPELRSVGIKAVEVEPGGYALVLRIPKSWSAPHRVSGTGRFHARNSKGKLELAVPELRAAFLAGQSAVDRLTGWRRRRLQHILADETYIPLTHDKYKYRLVLHLIPIQAADPTFTFDVASLHGRTDPLTLPRSISEHRRYAFFSFDGYCTAMLSNWDHRTSPPLYLQIFRNGCIELVDGQCLGEHGAVNHGSIERRFFDQPGATLRYQIDGQELTELERLLYIQRLLGVQPPIFLALSLLGVADLRILGPQVRDLATSRPIGQDTLILPEVLLEDYTCSPEQLRLVFDMLANASGHSRSYCFTEEGVWTGRSG